MAVFNHHMPMTFHPHKWLLDREPQTHIYIYISFQLLEIFLWIDGIRGQTYGSPDFLSIFRVRRGAEVSPSVKQDTYCFVVCLSFVLLLIVRKEGGAESQLNHKPMFLGLLFVSFCSLQCEIPVHALIRSVSIRFSQI